MIEFDYIAAENGQGKIALYHANKGQDIIEFVQNNRNELEQVILDVGGVILRNFSLRAVSEFSRLAESISPQLLEYVHRSTPRTRLGGKIYTATEYPAHKPIVLHNENAYTLSWPQRIMFFCVIVPESGGETPVADSRQILKKLDKKLVKKFCDKKILYKRNYMTGIDLSWQDVFQTSDRNEVNQYCAEHDIQYTWYDPAQDGLELTTQQICQVTLKHPTTQEEVWFNQAHLFHISTLDEMDREMLLSMTTLDRLPRNAYFGDEQPITAEDVQHILHVYETEKIMFQWQRGDVMVLDNLLMAHGRQPYTGERKIAVAMS